MKSLKKLTKSIIPLKKNTESIRKLTPSSIFYMIKVRLATFLKKRKYSCLDILTTDFIIWVSFFLFYFAFFFLKHMYLSSKKNQIYSTI